MRLPRMTRFTPHAPLHRSHAGRYLKSLNWLCNTNNIPRIQATILCATILFSPAVCQ